MFAKSTASRGYWISGQIVRRRSERRRAVRVAFCTWPILGCVMASFAAAACLVGACDKRGSVESRELRIAQTGTVRSVAFRADGEVLTSVGIDGSIVIWGRAGCIDHPFLPDGPGQVRSAAFSSDNRILATANLNEPVALHDIVGRASRLLDDRLELTTAAACVAFAPSGDILAVGQQNGRITLWDARTAGQCGTLDGHADFVAALAFAPDGTTVVSSSGDKTVRVWDLPTRRERLSIRAEDRTCGTLCLSPDGRLLAMGDHVSPSVRTFDLIDGRENESLEGAKGAIVALAASPDGSTIAAADLHGFVTFWDLATRKIGPKRLQHSGIRTLGFAPDGHALATGGFDGTVQIWDFPLAAAD